MDHVQLGVPHGPGEDSVNFSQLGEKLLNPHGLPRGLLDIDLLVAAESSCACEVAKLPTSEAAGETDSGTAAATNAEVEEMDTVEQEVPQVGKEPLCTKFGNSCKLANLVAMVGEGYSKPLLSNHLQGQEVKEGLVITILLKHQREKNPPSIVPKVLLSMTEKVLNDRLTYLNYLSMRKTKEEKRRFKMKLQAGVSQGLRKRKLEVGPRDDDQAPPAANKLFAATAVELVNRVGQFVQATASGPERRLNPTKTMEGILARKNQDEGTTPATEPEGEVSVSPSVEQPRVTVAKPPNQQVQARVNAGATRGRNSVVNPMFHTPPPPPWSHRGLGQGWCQRGERSVEPEV